MIGFDASAMVKLHSNDFAKPSSTATERCPNVRIAVPFAVCSCIFSRRKNPPWRSRRHQYPAREFALSVLVSQKGAGLRSAAPTFAISVFVQPWSVYAARCRLSSDRHIRWTTDPSPSSPSPRPSVLPSLPVYNGRTLSAVSKCYGNEICLRNIKKHVFELRRFALQLIHSHSGATGVF